MKQSFLSILLLSISVLLKAQMFDPVVWSFSYVQKEENVYELIFSSSIEKGSHIYGLEVPDGGPIPTSFSFETSSEYSLEGSIIEVIPANDAYDDAFGFNIKSYENKAEFRQVIKGDVSSFIVKGVVEYMVCNAISCSPPKEEEFSFRINGGDVNKESAVASNSISANANRGLLGFFVVSFLLGLLGVITPCVYPMIPFTVAFFSRSAKTRKDAITNALAFGVSIVLIYTAIGLIVSLSDVGAGFANTLSTHWIPNLVFFLLFVIFGLSFFGLFELTLPSKWSTSADSKVDKGGILGAFFMALTTVIVSFSCTGPIVGSLLVEAVRGDVLRPTIGMFAFGLAFSIPFTVLALSPSLVNKMPKSGKWLNAIKIAIGFIMLAFSMKFLMTIDSVYGFGILSRPIYLIIWIILFVLMGIVLIRGKGVLGKIFSVCAFLFAAYLVSGLFGNNLNSIAALLPMEKQSNKPVSGSLVNSGYHLPFNNNEPNIDQPKYGDLFSLPYGLKGFFDYQEGVEYAKKQGKPILIDFKGHACANCKRMEAKVWSDEAVLERLKNNFVIISLYVDDRTLLPEEEWITSDVDGKVKKTIGKINEDLEISMYNTNTLPLYVIADADGNPLITPSVTNLNIDEFIKWLDEGYSEFVK